MTFATKTFDYETESKQVGWGILISLPIIVVLSLWASCTWADGPDEEPFSEDLASMVTKIQGPSKEVLTAAEELLSAIDDVIDAREAGPVTEEKMTYLRTKHNDLSTALEKSVEAITVTLAAANEWSTQCVPAESSLQECVHRYRETIRFAKFATEAMAGQTSVANMLLLSEDLLSEEET